MKNFLISCNDTAPESGVDVIMQYLEVSPQCEELLDILNDENRPNLVVSVKSRIGIEHSTKYQNIPNSVDDPNAFFKMKPRAATS